MSGWVRKCQPQRLPTPQHLGEYLGRCVPPQYLKLSRGSHLSLNPLKPGKTLEFTINYVILEKSLIFFSTAESVQPCYTNRYGVVVVVRVVNFFTFDVSIWFLPLVRIVWIKEHLITTDSYWSPQFRWWWWNKQIILWYDEKKVQLYNQYVTQPTTNNQTTIYQFSVTQIYHCICLAKLFYKFVPMKLICGTIEFSFGSTINNLCI